MLVNAHHQSSAVAAGLATVTDVLTYYAEVEALYVRGKATPSGLPGQAPGDAGQVLVAHLKDAIVTVYSQTLQFLEDVVAFLGGEPTPLDEATDKTANKPPGGYLRDGETTFPRRPAIKCAWAGQYLAQLLMQAHPRPP